MSSNTPRLDLVERNLIINGNFDFWQRGTSGACASTGAYLADRWVGFATSEFSVTQSRSTDIPTQAQAGFQSNYSLLFTNGTGAAVSSAGYIEAHYRVEGYDYQTIHGRKVRFQFWCKSSVTGTFGLTFHNSANTRHYVTTFAVSAANTWQKIAVDVQLDTASSGWNFDNTIGLKITIGLSTGSTYQESNLNQWVSGQAYGASGQTNWGATTGATFQLSQVMLIPQDFTQAGSSTVDVPFQRCGRSIGHELQLCQRYCYATGWDKTASMNNQPIANMGVIFSSPNAYMDIQFPQNMRAAPSLSSISSPASQFSLNASSGGNSPLSSMTFQQVSTTGAQLLCVGSVTIGTSTTLYVNTTGASLVFDAEL